MSDEPVEPDTQSAEEAPEGPPPGYVPGGGFAGSEKVEGGEVVLSPPEAPDGGDAPAEDPEV